METDTIEYRTIPGFSAYRAGTDGSIWSCLRAQASPDGKAMQADTGNRTRKLRPELRKEDHRKRYTLRRNDGKLVRKYGSYFVLLAFSGPKPEGYEACHNDGNCTNDKPSNLRWGAVIENKADMVAHGTRPVGEKVNFAKLTSSQVMSIRERRASGVPPRVLAQEYSVTPELIWMIATRKIWRHL
jgi:hypothetical protein